ncbi:hypothetical protein EB796_000414 [Bugula neritina]|uniref:Uncharacterized protein n=1 Tax=Bugula neritina TaxID=10212 RepID=A0A7J7KST6_BUGNE|nr:hypothetical protein EB796_000414 [Bugula neritina]
MLCGIEAGNYTTVAYVLCTQVRLMLLHCIVNRLDQYTLHNVKEPLIPYASYYKHLSALLTQCCTSIHCAV